MLRARHKFSFCTFICILFVLSVYLPAYSKIRQVTGQGNNYDLDGDGTTDFSFAYNLITNPPHSISCNSPQGGFVTLNGFDAHNTLVPTSGAISFMSNPMYSSLGIGALISWSTYTYSSSTCDYGLTTNYFYTPTCNGIYALPSQYYGMTNGYIPFKFINLGLI